jgi:molybdopterin molybdotransferase
MLSVSEALDAVMLESRALPLSVVPLAQARGCVLAEDIHADIDSPPFDKALVDGFAVRSGDLLESGFCLRIGELLTAGRQPSRALEAGEAAAIMTGAPIPEGCDAVVMHERTSTEDGLVRFEKTPVKPGQNLLPKGAEMRAGQVVLPRGALLHPTRLGILASVGRTEVRVIARPQVAVVPTGDELVEPGEKPGPGQIRNSNAVMLRALAEEAGALASCLPIAPDEPLELSRILEQALGVADLVLVTGGVSAGQRDLVPDSLAALGVRRVFHKVSVKPGKPLWFGVAPLPCPGKAGALVIGLPGNPVSGLVSFLLFAAPALAALAGRFPVSPSPREATLVQEFSHRGNRTTYHPARLVRPATKGRLPSIETLRWSGSSDLLTVASSDGFAIFPGGDRDYNPDEVVNFLPLN